MTPVLLFKLSPAGRLVELHTMGVAVLARLGLARNQLRRDKELAETTLREVQADGRRALESLQELVRGIHPPILTDRGLLDAVRERAARLPITTDAPCAEIYPDECKSQTDAEFE